MSDERDVDEEILLRIPFAVGDLLAAKDGVSELKMNRPYSGRRCMPRTTFLPLLLIVLYCLSVSRLQAQDSPPPTTSKTAQPTPEVDRKLISELKSDIVMLAETIGERNLRRPAALRKAVEYIEKEFRKAGFKVERQEFEARGQPCVNLIAELAGTGKKREEILIIGAHYDSAEGTPAANDNGSGVAAMLALARRLVKTKPNRTIRFVAFTNEEPPYFQRENEMGSWVYAREAKRRDDNIIGVISLETMGYYTDRANSQRYPYPLNLLYPSTGNFVGFVANPASREFYQETLNSFRKHSSVPAEGACLPDRIQGVGWSDHWSFWQEGYPGLMITDTAPFRYPHYHKSTDTPDKINYRVFSQVVAGLLPVTQQLASPQSKPPEKPGDKS